MLTRSSIHRLSQEDPDNCGFITKQLGRAGSFCWVRARLCISTSFLLTTTTSTGPGGVAVSVLRSQEGKGGLRLAGRRHPWTHFSLVSSPSVWHSPRPSAVLGTQGSRACTDLQSQTRTSSDPCLTFKWGFIPQSLGHRAEPPGLCFTPAFFYNYYHRSLGFQLSFLLLPSPLGSSYSSTQNILVSTPFLVRSSSSVTVKVLCQRTKGHMSCHFPHKLKF